VNLTLTANNLSNEHRTLTMTLTLERINSIDQSNSMLKEYNEISSQDSYTDLNTYPKGPQPSSQSFVQIFRLEYNQRK
jgi:hypothetical protein